MKKKLYDIIVYYQPDEAIAAHAAESIMKAFEKWFYIYFVSGFILGAIILKIFN